MAFLRYTLLRLAVFAATLAVLWVVGLRGFWLLLAAVFLSGLVSLLVLSRSRDAASEALSGRLGRIRRRMEERASAEDAWDDEQRRSAGDAGDAGDAGRHHRDHPDGEATGRP